MGTQATPRADFRRKFGGDLQIFDKALIFQRLGLRIGQPQQIGRMHRHQSLASVGEVNQPAAGLVDQA